MEWVRETPARWDASKADVLGERSQWLVEGLQVELL